MGLVRFEQPKTVREFAVIFLETLLTIWFKRFGIDVEKVDAAVCSLLVKYEDFLSNRLTGIVPVDKDPASKALECADDGISDMLDGNPVTEEKVMTHAAISLFCSLLAELRISGQPERVADIEAFSADVIRGLRAQLKVEM